MHTAVGVLALGLIIGLAVPSGQAAQTGAALAPVPITFQVQVPAGTPTGAEIRIAGGIPELGTWDGRGLLLQPQPDGAFVGTVPVAPGTFVEFKVTRGGWDTVEKDAQGREIANRSLVVSKADTLQITVAAWRDQGKEAPRPSTLTGDVRHHPAFAGTNLARSRDVWVWLPPGYDRQPERRYPVLYMHDGQNVFDAATSFIGVEWAADETAARLIENGEMEPIIIVAVANTSARTQEYSPFADGQGPAYGRFLVEELKPFIDRTYRTQPELSGLAGSSLGGLITMNLGLAYPQVFSRLGVISAAVFWGEQGAGLLQQVAASAKPAARIWVDVGTLEGVTPGDHAEWLRGARALRQALLDKGFVEGADLFYLEDEGAVHNEGAWAGRLDRVLRFLFPARE